MNSQGSSPQYDLIPTLVKGAPSLSMAATIDEVRAAARPWGQRERGHSGAEKLPEGIPILIHSAPRQGGDGATEEPAAMRYSHHCPEVDDGADMGGPCIGE